MALRLSANQLAFAKRFAALTGLNTRTVQGWIINEEPQNAKGTVGRGDQNWLNIGITDKGPLGFTHSSVWRDPIKAADESAAFIKGQKYGASQGIRDILKTRGQSPMAQVKAIQGSGWASGGETALANLVGQAEGLHGLPNASLGPPATPRPTTTLAHSARAPAPPTTRVVTTTRQVAPDQSLQDAISQLAAQQQQQPQGLQVGGGFDPGNNKYLAGAPQAPVATSAPTAPAGDVTSQVAGLSQLVGPSTFVSAKTVTSPGVTPTGQPNPTPVQSKTAITPPAKVHPAPTQDAGADRASAFANAHIGAYAESMGSNRGPQLDRLEALSGFPGSGQPWCAMFATTAVVHGGAPKSARTAAVARIADFARAGINGYQKGILPTTMARKGDLVMRNTDHVGYVDGRTPDGKIIVIEGNANGSGGVAKRTYAPGAWTGVARPKYGR